MRDTDGGFVYRQAMGPGCLKLVFTFAFGLPALGMLTTAAFFAHSTLSFGEGAIRTTGVIEQPNPPLATFWVDDAKYEVVGSVSSEPPAYAMGEEVEILYRPEDPSIARINSFTENWLVTSVFGVLGLVFGGISVGAGFAAAFGLRRLKEAAASLPRLETLASASRVSRSPDPAAATPPTSADPPSSESRGITATDEQTIVRMLRMGARGEALRYAERQLGLSEREARALVRRLDT